MKIKSIISSSSYHITWWMIYHGLKVGTFSNARSLSVSAHPYAQPYFILLKSNTKHFVYIAYTAYYYFIVWIWIHKAENDFHKSAITLVYSRVRYRYFTKKNNQNSRENFLDLHTSISREPSKEQWINDSPICVCVIPTVCMCVWCWQFV